MTINDHEFSRLVSPVLGPLLLFARQWDAEHAEDFVQDALLKLLREIEKRGVPQSVSAWLFTVVRRDAISRLRKKKASRNYTETVLKDRPLWFEPALDAKVDADEVTARLQELPLEQREIIVAKIWGDLSFDELAELLKMPKTTAYRKYTEAIEELKKTVGRRL